MKTCCEQLIRAGLFLQLRKLALRIKLQAQLKLDQSTIIVEFLASNADIMAIRVVEFSNGGYKIRKIFA